MTPKITPLILLISLLAMCCSAAVTIEDFEAWTGNGTAVADPDDPNNTVLALTAGEVAEISLPVDVGIITIDVYDFGEAAPDPTSAYGPRWGIMGSDSSSNPLSVAASIIYKSWINGSIGYGMSSETSQTGSWWSPSYFGGPRQCTVETWTDSDSDGVLDTDQNNGSGQWTTWTFEIFADGTAEIRAPFGSGGQTVKSQWSDSTDMIMENLEKVWISGGKTGACVGPVASGIYSGYTVLVDNITQVNIDFASTPSYQDDFDPNWDPIANDWRIATWTQNNTIMSADRCDDDGQGHLVQTVLAGGPPYYGGSMQSRVEYPYGRWVANVRPSCVAGVLNSIFTNDWDDMTTPNDYNDGSHFEVDIEFLTYTFGTNSGQVHLAVHTSGYSNLYSQDLQLDFNPSDDYHEWGFDILPDRVRWHLDGEVIATFEKPSYVDFPENYEMFFNSWTRDTWIYGPPAQDADYYIDSVKFYPLIASTANVAPVSDAGSDQSVTDSDDDGYESVALDGSGSSDSDGTIVSYVWTENSTQIATGSQPTVSLAVGTHTITLTVTDDDSATDTDTVVVTVSEYTNVAPVADTGSDQSVTDSDDDGYESVTLDGTGSSDSDGTIVSYVWTENSTQIATGSQPTVSLAVGTHTITLIVTDDDGATDTDTVEVVVSEYVGAVLTVVETTGDYYTITAHDYGDASSVYWEVKVDITSGGIFSFKDYTDAGDGSGGHTDYCGDGAYNRQATLFYFQGRGGRVFSRKLALTDLADRLSFTTAPDGSSFTISYTEDALSSAYFHSSYADGSYSLTPGDLYSTIQFVINAPDENGTAWDWSIDCENVSGHSLSGKIWAGEFTYMHILDDIVASYDYENSLLDGAWYAADPESFMAWTIGSNPALGLTTGRQLISDVTYGLADQTAGGTVSTGTWAGYNYVRYVSGYNYDTNLLTDQAIRTIEGKLMIDIPLE